MNNKGRIVVFISMITAVMLVLITLVIQVVILSAAKSKNGMTQAPLKNWLKDAGITKHISYHCSCRRYDFFRRKKTTENYSRIFMRAMVMHFMHLLLLYRHEKSYFRYTGWLQAGYSRTLMLRVSS